MYGSAVTEMNTTLGEWLEREFERRGWDTLFKASKGLDLPVQTIHDLLKKPKNPSPATLRKLADGLQVSLEFLFNLIGYGVTRGGVPQEGRALPESVRGLSEQSYSFLSQMTPDELERFLALLEQQRRPRDSQ